MTDTTATMTVVGKRLPRVDAGERVTGRAIYPADFTRPNMAFGALKRSPHPHARILSIDTSKAKALKGVLAVVTAADFPVVPVGTMIPFGETGADAWVSALTVIARDKALWCGHPVAAVAAVDSYIAAKAVDLIEVSYEVLPAVMDIPSAQAAGAPVLHPEHKPGGFDAARPAPRNAGSRTVIARGEAAPAFAAAAAVGAMTATVDTAHQGYIEPMAVVAETDGSGNVTIWSSSQGAFPTEIQTAVVLGLSQAKLKVVPLEVGGAFGGKITVHVEPIAARLAQKCGRPVKIVTSRTETMTGGSGPASAATFDIKVAADAEGRLTAIEGTYVLDTGGIPGTPTTLMMQASAAPYQAHAPKLHLEGWDILTNKPRTEAYRGPGGIQAAFAMEQAIDELALELGMCPLELRRRNASVTGNTMPIGTPFPSIAFDVVAKRVAEHDCWTSPLGKGSLPRGRGLAFGYWRGTSMTSAAHVTLSGDGKPQVTLGAVDISGVRTTMAQVAAEEFGLGIDDVHILMGDTKSAGYSDMSAGSRVGRTMAAAVSYACKDALAQVKPRAAQKLQCPAEEVEYAGGVFRAGGASISLSDLMRATLTEGAIIGRGVSTKLPYGVECGAHVCDVEVDPETGQVTILRYTAFQDVGRALNPVAVEGQIEGSVSQGLGWALTEAFDYAADGRLRNASLLDYRMPTALDMPTVDVVIIETPVPDVPYGVRGVAEMPIVPVAGCVGNAVRRAIGVRMTQMPMTPERIVKALKTKR